MHKLMDGCAENELATENATRESISKQQMHECQVHVYGWGGGQQGWTGASRMGRRRGGAWTCLGGSGCSRHSGCSQTQLWERGRNEMVTMESAENAYLDKVRAVL